MYLGAKRSELRPSSLKNFTGALRQFPAKNLGEVTTFDIAQALRPLPPSNANLCQAIFKAFLNWCVDKGHISSNPIAAQSARTRPRAVTGLLTDDEIKAIWLASYRYGDFGALCRALILSGQRLNQFNSFQHSWIENFDRHRLPGIHHEGEGSSHASSHRQDPAPICQSARDLHPDLECTPAGGQVRM